VYLPGGNGWNPTAPDQGDSFLSPSWTNQRSGGVSLSVRPVSSIPELIGSLATLSFSTPPPRREPSSRHTSRKGLIVYLPGGSGGNPTARDQAISFLSLSWTNQRSGAVLCPCDPPTQCGIDGHLGYFIFLDSHLR